MHHHLYIHTYIYIQSTVYACVSEEAYETSLNVDDVKACAMLGLFQYSNSTQNQHPYDVFFFCFWYERVHIK